MPNKRNRSSLEEKIEIERGALILLKCVGDLKDSEGPEGTSRLLYVATCRHTEIT
jgi:hypothetical protein